MRTMTLLLASIVLALALTACGGGGDSGWTAVEETALTEAQGRQLERAREARAEMFTRLSGELKKSLQASGPASAITVCRDAAPAVAKEMSEKHGLTIGRTSHKLRNPANTPPTWAASVVEEQTGKETYLAGPAGQLGVLFPIRAQAPCLTCHGDTDAMPDDVKTAIAENYAEDAATGFAVEDLRGWFWVEVGAE